MENEDTNFIKLKSVIILQNRFREIKENLSRLNENMLKTKCFQNSLVTRLQISRETGILEYDKYNEHMEKMENIKILFDKLPAQPITFNSFNKLSSMSVQIHLAYIEGLINDVCKDVGADSLLDLLKIACGNNWIKNLDDDFIQYIIFYDKYLDAFKYQIIEQSNKTDMEEILDIAKNEGFTNPKELPFCTRSYPTVTKSFIEKIEGIKLYIPYQNGFVNIYGIFKKDSLNLAKSCSLFKEKYDNVYTNLGYLQISDHFKYKFLEQMSLRDFVSNSEKEIINKVKNAHSDLTRLKSKSLSIVVREFMKSTLEKQRRTIILLLLSKDSEDKFLSHIIFDMISNNSFMLKAQPYSNNIYNSLHWSVQKIFKITNKDMEREQNRIKSLTEEDIPYEKRIALLKTTDKVKGKAYDKLKEMNGTRESSTKAQQYLDGVLKIPFGVQQKEAILSYLDDFKMKLKVTLSSIIDNIDDLKNTKLNEVVEIIKKCGQNIDTENEIDAFINLLVSKLETINSDLISTEIFDNESESSMDIKICNYDLNKKLIDECIKEIKNIQSIRRVLVSNNANNVTSLERMEDLLINIERKLGIEDKKNSPRTEKKYKSVSNVFESLNELVTDWNDYKKKKQDYIRNVRKTLDKCVYGHKECKQQIQRVVAQWMNGKMEGAVLGLQGPPGTGKTSIAKHGISKCLVDADGNARPFCFLPLGGSTNGSTLEGHNYTYLGSTWGRLADMIMDAKCMNPVIYIDEIDKISLSEHGREITGILTHVTDPSQNQEFTDRYFSGIPLDFSKVLFIFAYNDRSRIDRILLDRITEIKVKALSRNDKLKIARYYLLPEILEQVGYKEGDIILNKAEVNFIIENYTYEAGVRKLKEKLFEIVREINLRKIMDLENYVFPYTVNKETIEKIFTDNKIIIKKCASSPHVGMINGLYATSSGVGGLTIIEVHKTITEQKLNLELTGSQGDVMKESMKVAKTLAWNIIPDDIKRKINQEWDDTGPYGLHIHCPEGATPKDGPSAGTAITCAIISRLCNVPIKNTVAMTGEIDLNGRVTAIGGVDSKVDGAKRAGAKTVILPKENKEDYIKYLKKLEEALLASDEHSDQNIELDKEIDVIYVSHINDVIPYIFVDNNMKFNLMN